MFSYHLNALVLLLVSYMYMPPLLHLGCVLLYCLAHWILRPKDTLPTSILTCIYLVIFQHVSLETGLGILISHPVVLLVVGCLMAHVIIKNELHLVISDYLMAKAKPSSEFSLVIMMMGIAGFLSMWVSNTSVVAMMIPVVINLSSTLKIKADRLLLAIAYGATIGGMLTPIGTPANLVAIDYASRYFDIHINFTTWMLWASPLVLMLSATLSVYFWKICSQATFTFTQKPAEVTAAQRKILSLLGLCILLWATQQAPFGGWAALIGFPVQEEYIGLMILTIIAFIPYKGIPAVALNDLTKLPFASICMVITGIYMAEGLVQKNVIDILMNSVIEGQSLYGYQTLALFGFMLSFLTELCSNTAITSLGLPLSSMMMKLSHIGALPCIFLITFSANSAFMLPTATPPNALILGTGHLSSRMLFSVGAIISICSLVFLVVLLSLI